MADVHRTHGEKEYESKKETACFKETLRETTREGGGEKKRMENKGRDKTREDR